MYRLERNLLQPRGYKFDKIWFWFEIKIQFAITEKGQIKHTEYSRFRH